MHIKQLSLDSGTLYFNGIELDGAVMTDISDPYKTQPTPVFSTGADMSFEAELSSVNFPMLNNLIGLHKTMDATYTIILNKPIQVQRRRHKKKRINKKWAKRYGYKTVFKKMRINNVTITSHENGIDFGGILYE